MLSLAAIVTNSRSVTAGASVGSGLMLASGGVSDGQTKVRSMRACAPGRRCTLKRIEAGGTLNAIAADRDRQGGRVGGDGRGVGHSI